MLDEEMKAFLLSEAKARFLRYVQIDTQSDPESKKHPSSDGQWNLAKVLKQELEAVGLTDVVLDQHCYVYATRPGSAGVRAPAITLCAHLDTSPSVSGADVSPVIHENYGGDVIRFPLDEKLTLSPDDCPELSKFIGGNIITASGNTLLGADDKAGIAEIMAALAAFHKFDHLPHPELRIVFTPDEEIGEGADHIDMQRLGTYGYTIDGSQMGELEEECFDAFEVKLMLEGINVHPGYAKNRMVNAGAIAARLAAALPEFESPEHTAKREGFFHLTEIKGNESNAVIKIILRDFEQAKNLKRIELLKQLVRAFELRYPGLKIQMNLKDQYNNMQEVLKRSPQVVQKADQAIKTAGVDVIKKPIRGGTDGARLSFMGMPTPNIFAGGLMFHSKKEWIPEIALQKGAEVIVHLCGLWTGNE